jgi:hypothetical protein
MYESLKKYSDKFHLYIFAFDDNCLNLLKTLDLDYATIISLSEFEDEKLLEVKVNRSAGEYCWTCTPSVIKYAIQKHNLENCTYLEADLYFFSNPSVLIDEMENKSILISEHRYTAEYDKSLRSGKYCVQFMTFKNDYAGMMVLNWWRESCINWCYARYEDGKFGDQKYLDDWTTRFDGVHVLKNLGGGVAPWNIQQYKLEDNPFDLVFYHFHGFKFLSNNKVDLGGYKLRKEDIKILYQPYLNHLEKIKFYILTKDKRRDYHGTSSTQKDWKLPLKYFKRLVKRSYTVYDKNYILRL